MVFWKINQKNYSFRLACQMFVIDGSTEVLLYVNENRQKILENTINLQPLQYN